jgi:methylated-DNA-[protein]-cysteine S-methyltransferase
MTHDTATRAFLARAVAEGIIDVAVGEADSPFGTLTIAVTDQGLVRLAYPNETPDLVLDELAMHVSPRVVRLPKRTDEVRRELDDYFEGRRHAFDVAVDFTMCGSGFRRRLLEATARIPYGELRTYRDMAAAAGNDKAVRAAGNALGSNPIPIVVPCHRVVRTGGGLGGYTGGLDRKVRLLGIEGVLLP